jgi:hypothetical protein
MSRTKNGRTLVRSQPTDRHARPSARGQHAFPETAYSGWVSAYVERRVRVRHRCSPGGLQAADLVLPRNCCGGRIHARVEIVELVL